ncbi:MAG: hypothetical protein ACR2O3_15300 [Rhizobiaceae bacterium]
MIELLGNRIVTLALVWGALPGAHLVDLGYSFFSLEVFALSLIFAAVGAILGYVFRRKYLYGIALATSIYVFVDIYFFYSQLWVFCLTVLVCLTVLLLIEKVTAPINRMLSAFALFFFLSTALKPEMPLVQVEGPLNSNINQDVSAVAAASGTPILHIILDEQMSPLAEPATLPDNHPSHQMLQDYEDLGFRIFDKVAAPHHWTLRSVGSLMKLELDTRNYKKLPRGSRYSYVIEENRYLDRLLENNYEPVFLQNSFFNLCGTEPRVECRTYRRANNMGVFERMDLPVGQRVSLAFLGLIRDYTNTGGDNKNLLPYVWFHRKILTRNFPIPQTFKQFSSPPFALELIKESVAEIETMRAGDSLFLHFLLPHNPFVLDSACNMNPIKDWRFLVHLKYDYPVEEVHKNYWDQVECTHRTLMQIFSKLQREDIYIIVHGDHGARLSGKNADPTTDDKLLSFLAIRGPSINPGRISERRDMIQTFSNEFEKIMEAR